MTLVQQLKGKPVLQPSVVEYINLAKYNISFLPYCRLTRDTLEVDTTATNPELR